jgi:NAD(P) transhydrogenase subunit alpha
MSGTNAIHGIVVVGGILVLGSAHGATETWLRLRRRGVRRDEPRGRFVVTDRMLGMFKGKPRERRP